MLSLALQTSRLRLLRMNLLIVGGVQGVDSGGILRLAFQA